MSVSVVIAGGGTAGHVYPGLAVARAILAVDPAAEVAFVGTSRGIEGRAVPQAGFELDLVDVMPFSTSLGARRFLAPLSLVKATVQARRVLKRRRAQAVVGMGGYASLPVAFAAASMRVPLVLHEQNAVPGLANVVAAFLAKRVAVTFSDAVKGFPRRSRVRVLGNPLRPEIVDLDRVARRTDALRMFGLADKPRTVVVIGGSLGAARLNEATVQLAELWEKRPDVQILLSAGPRNGAAVRASAGHLQGLVVVDFIDQVELAYAVADVLICRAGASGVTEAACVGLPSILVPYPFARRGHQEANARALERAGGAVVVPDAEATGERLAREVDSMLSDPERLAQTSRAARAFAKPGAAHELASWVLEAVS